MNGRHNSRALCDTTVHRGLKCTRLPHPKPGSKHLPCLHKTKVLFGGQPRLEELLGGLPHARTGGVGGGHRHGHLGPVQLQAHRQARALPQRGGELPARRRARALHAHRRLRAQRRQVHRLKQL